MKINASVEADTSGVSGSEVTVDATIDAPDVGESVSEAEVDVTVKKKTKVEPELSAFDDQFMDGNIDG